jgi:hypothetical protein
MSDHQLGDGPVEPSLVEFLNSIAFALDQILNGKEVATDKSLRKNGFVLLVFPFGDTSGRCNYISNGANRDDIVKMFREQIKRFEETARGEGL